MGSHRVSLDSESDFSWMRRAIFDCESNFAQVHPPKLDSESNFAGSYMVILDSESKTGPCNPLELDSESNSASLAARDSPHGWAHDLRARRIPGPSARQSVCPFAESDFHSSHRRSVSRPTAAAVSSSPLFRVGRRLSHRSPTVRLWPESHRGKGVPRVRLQENRKRRRSTHGIGGTYGSRAVVAVTRCLAGARVPPILPPNARCSRA